MKINKILMVVLLVLFTSNLYAVKHKDLPADQCHLLDMDKASTGTLSHEYGGVEADVSSYDGAVKISGGVTSQVAIATQDSSALVTVGDSLRLYHKGLEDSTVWFYAKGDTTKKVLLNLASLTTGNTRTVTFIDTNFTIVGMATTQTLRNKTIDGDDNTLQDIHMSSLEGIDNDSTHILTTDGIKGGGSKKTVTPSDTTITVAQFQSGYVQFDASSDSIDVVLPGYNNFGVLAKCVFVCYNTLHDIDIETATGEYIGLGESDSVAVRDSVLSFMKKGGCFILENTGNGDPNGVQWLITGHYYIDLHNAD